MVLAFQRVSACLEGQGGTRGDSQEISRIDSAGCGESAPPFGLTIAREDVFVIEAASAQNRLRGAEIGQIPHAQPRAAIILLRIEHLQLQ
ncbi:MAG: hypothetical protein BroJett021_42500 [Chloroflexota bacterium]|jgi:hypothetical protein|nr:hypothetical protein [Caldilinea sp.]GIK75262.1 MAG: hypothetical protein BroJett021_42500 [Chloroflexota bacterium]